MRSLLWAASDLPRWVQTLAVFVGALAPGERQRNPAPAPVEIRDVDPKIFMS